MKKMLLVASILLLSISLSSCALDGIIGNSGEVQIINSNESNLSVEFPDSWDYLELNEEASIQMALPIKEQYLIVLEESIEDFVDDCTLEDYTSLVMENMEISIIDAEISDIIDVTTNNNLNAKQFEISGSSEKIKIKFLVTCIENNGIFYQFSAWSLQSKYDDAKPVFEEILNSVNFI